MNNVVLIGRLARDPELSYTPNTQTANCHFTLAVDRPKKQGADQGADFIRIIVWGKQAESCDRYLSKGRQAAVLGRIQSGSYKNKEGQTVYTTDVVADRVEFLGSGNSGQQNNQSAYGDQAPAGQPSNSSGYYQPQQAPPAQAGPQQMGFDDMPDSFQAAEDDVPF